MKFWTLVTLTLFGISAFAVDPYHIPESFPKSSGMALISNFSGCSASVFRFDDSKDSDPAMVLTNGHCSGQGSYYGMYPDGDDVFVNLEDPNSEIYLYNTEASAVFPTHVQKLKYATMVKFDVAVYELPMSYEDLQDLGVQALLLKRSPEYQAGQILKMPSSYWKQTYACEFEAQVNFLLEGPWTWEDSLRFKPDNCLLKGGMSGSPLVNDQNEIVGVINTTYSGGEACTIMNPCEKEFVDSDPQVLDNYGYGSPVSELYSCRDENGLFDATVESCTLPQASQ